MQLYAGLCTKVNRPVIASSNNARNDEHQENTKEGDEPSSSGITISLISRIAL